MNQAEEMALTREPHKLLSLQACRGIAAILVVLFHSGGIMGLPKYFGRVPLHGFFGFGYAGVDFFFVLSGFIILYVHHKDIGIKGKLLPYLTKRFIRIYPLHWFVLCLFMIGLVVYPFDGHPDTEKIVCSFLLVPQQGYPIGVVAWTLIYEVFFYLLFSVLIFNREVGMSMFLIWFFILTIGVLTIGNHAGYLTKFVFSLHNFEFMLGMLVALAIRQWHWRANWRWLGATGVVLFAVAASVNNPLRLTAPNLLLLLYALGSAAMIYALAAGDLLGRLPRYHPSLVFLGSASYSIYLIHFLTLSVLIKILMRIGADQWLPLDVNYLLLVFVAIGVGSILHVYVERPLLKWSRARMLPTQATA